LEEFFLKSANGQEGMEEYLMKFFKSFVEEREIRIPKSEATESLVLHHLVLELVFEREKL